MSHITPTIPVFNLFNLDPDMYQRVCIYAHKQNKGICTAMQDLMELGMYTYMEYDRELQEFKPCKSLGCPPKP